MPRAIGQLIIDACREKDGQDWFRSNSLGPNFYGTRKYSICHKAVIYGMMDYDDLANLYRVRQSWERILAEREAAKKPVIKEKVIQKQAKQVKSDCLSKSQIAALAFTTVQHAMKNRHPLELVWG